MTTCPSGPLFQVSQSLPIFLVGISARRERVRFLQQEPHFGQRVRQILAKEKEDDDGRTTFPFKSRTTVKIEGDEMEARNSGATTIRDPATILERREREKPSREPTPSRKFDFAIGWLN